MKRKEEEEEEGKRKRREGNEKKKKKRKYKLITLVTHCYENLCFDLSLSDLMHVRNLNSNAK